jgi:hypothetical protein
MGHFALPNVAVTEGVNESRLYLNLYPGDNSREIIDRLLGFTTLQPTRVTTRDATVVSVHAIQEFPRCLSPSGLTPPVPRHKGTVNWRTR